MIDQPLIDFLADCDERIPEESISTHDPFWWLGNVPVSLVCATLIVVLGIAAIVLHQRTKDFWGEDVFYADAASNLLHHGFYGVNGDIETTQPPGLSLILAGIFAVFGYSYAICVQTMAVFFFFKQKTAYEVLRKRAGVLVAATICMILV